MTAEVERLFFFNDTATTEIYTLSLHDALPISVHVGRAHRRGGRRVGGPDRQGLRPDRRPRRDLLQLLQDRKSTRLNSSHANISYAVFCLKKKKISLSPFSSRAHYSLLSPGVLF